MKSLLSDSSLMHSYSFYVTFPPVSTLCSNLRLYQMVKNLPAMQETLVQSLGEEDPLEKGMATHSSILA